MIHKHKKTTQQQAGENNLKKIQTVKLLKKNCLSLLLKIKASGSFPFHLKKISKIKKIVLYNCIFNLKKKKKLKAFELILSGWKKEKK